MAVAAAVAGLALAPGANAGTIHIGVGDDFFDPEEISQPFTGAVFDWDWNDDIADEHNVRQDNKLFRSGPTTSDPNASYPGVLVLPAGRFHYYCEEHGTENGGMDGELRVSPRAALPEGDEVAISWAQDSADQVGDRWQVQYRVDGGEWKSWFKSTGRLLGNFGRNNKPANLNQDRVYQVKVKTKLAANPKRRSKFSPPVTFPEN